MNNQEVRVGSLLLSINIGLDYLGCSFDINMQTSSVQINWTSGGSCDDLDITSDVPAKENEFQSKTPGRIVFPLGPFTIKRKTPSSCPLPEETGVVKSSGSATSSSAFTSLTFLALLKSLV